MFEISERGSDPAAHSRDVEGVINLSEGGMLVADNTLTVGEQTGFELSGPSFHYAGVAEVMHLTNETTGLRFLSWQARDNRPFRSLIEQRAEWQAPANAGDQRADPVVRRVAVLTGPKRQSPPPPAGGSSVTAGINRRAASRRSLRRRGRGRTAGSSRCRPAGGSYPGTPPRREGSGRARAGARHQVRRA